MTRTTAIQVATGARDNRLTLRRAVRLNARVRDRTAARFGIRVLDLSRTGFRGETTASLRPGSIIWIALPGLRNLEARVAWQRGEHIGAAFQQPLHPAVLDHIVALAR